MQLSYLRWFNNNHTMEVNITNGEIHTRATLKVITTLNFNTEFFNIVSLAGEIHKPANAPNIWEYEYNIKYNKKSRMFTNSNLLMFWNIKTRIFTISLKAHSLCVYFTSKWSETQGMICREILSRIPAPRIF